MPTNKKNKNVAQSFDDGYRTYSRPILKFGPGEKDPYKGARKRRRKKFRPANDNIA
jgi:hypothetical protein